MNKEPARFGSSAPLSYPPIPFLRLHQRATGGCLVGPVSVIPEDPECFVELLIDAARDRDAREKDFDQPSWLWLQPQGAGSPFQNFQLETLNVHLDGQRHPAEAFGGNQVKCRNRHPYLLRIRSTSPRPDKGGCVCPAPQLLHSRPARQRHLIHLDVPQVVVGEIPAEKLHVPWQWFNSDHVLAASSRQARIESHVRADVADSLR